MSGKLASKPMLALALGTATLVGIGAYAWRESFRPAILEIAVFDTPGAPAMFIRTPGDKRILVDGGSNAEIVRRLTGELPFYSRRIDMAIVTVPDGRHVTGLVDVLQRYVVDKVVVPAVTLENLGLVSSTDTIYRTLLDAVEELHLPLQPVMAGDRLVLDPGSTTTPPVFLDVIFPVSSDRFEYSRASGPEIVFRILFGSTSVVFAGGASPKVQKFIAAQGASGNLSGRADVLVVSHGATATSLSSELLKVLRPSVVVYSRQISGKQVSRLSKNGQSQKSDPLAGFLKDQISNVRDQGKTKITSDGEVIRIIRW